MIGKAYILKNCTTCKRILKGVRDYGSFEIIDIKNNPPSIEEVDELAKLAGSYEAIFNKQSKKYREKGLAHKNLTEEQFREYIIEEYTFLKRPAFHIGNQVFVGSSNKVVTSLNNYLSVKVNQH